MVWMSAGAVVGALMLLFALLLLLATNGLTYFWPRPLVLLQGQEPGSPAMLGVIVGQDNGGGEYPDQLLLFRGSDENFQSPVLWIDEANLASRSRPEQAVEVERDDQGSVFGFIESARVRGRDVVANELSLEEMRSLLRQVKTASDSGDATSVQFRLANGRLTRFSLDGVVALYLPNAMSVADKLQHFFASLWRFLSQEPRQSNLQGGVFPAIVGTVVLVVLMSLIVSPLGVLAALYLHEYAQENLVTRMVRIAVNNLAGVPSNVYGVFGLGFFVYAIGGSLDNIFFADRLPAPTLGTPGLLWAALTMALLTLPVVIVATEEGLARVPGALREGALALGATRAETVWKVVLPSAAPAVLTGLILAVARATGEVAPLILVGVAKYAPGLPVSLDFPFVHFDRQFMHLGFYIYDLGFQSPQIETMQGMVYATALLLVGIVLLLNLAAVGLRGRLREAFAVEESF